ncbi:MAG: hypothetical protein AAF655_22550 [Bacteroidota bacterium]
MNKVKVLSWAVVGLLVLNTLAITALILGRPGGPLGPPSLHPSNAKPVDRVIRQLGFDHSQADELSILITTHKENIQGKEEILRDLRIQMFSLLATTSYEAREKLMEEIATIQQEIEEIHFQHFLSIKQLCKKEQLPAYHELVKELTSWASRNPQATPPRR